MSLNGQRRSRLLRTALPTDVVDHRWRDRSARRRSRHVPVLPTTTSRQTGSRCCSCPAGSRSPSRSWAGLRGIGPSGMVTRADYGADPRDRRPTRRRICRQLRRRSWPSDVWATRWPFAGRARPSRTCASMLRKDPATGALAMPGRGARRRDGPDHYGEPDEIVRASGDAVHRAVAAFPAGHTPSGRAALLVRDAQVPARNEDRGGSRRGARSCLRRSAHRSACTAAVRSRPSTTRTRATS